MLEMSTLGISYTCPECSTRLRVEVTYLPAMDKKVNYTKGLWCKRCNARHKIEYSVTSNRKNEVQFKVKEFSSNDEMYKKRFSVLPSQHSTNRRKKR